MPRLSNPSDFTTINPNYANGNGYYTTHSAVSNLLHISGSNDASYFTSSTTPSIGMVGDIIKRVEGKIDDEIKLTFRPEIIEKEVHDFQPWVHATYPIGQWKDYVGFTQLDSQKVSKIIRLEVWQGDTYKDLAGAGITYTPSATAIGGAYTITLVAGPHTFVLDKGTDFIDSFGQKTTVKEICYAINEKFPHETAQFTGETTSKGVAANSGTRTISDFFYATPTEDGKSVYIASLLPSDAGTLSTLASTHGSPTSATNFSDNDDRGRLSAYWTIGTDGQLFFRNAWPYQQKHSIRVTYVRGGSRVPSTIHEAATKMVAAEVLLHDDNSVLITETGANIDLKTKHDTLLEEANKIIEGKKQLLFLID